MTEKHGYELATAFIGATTNITADAMSAIVNQKHEELFGEPAPENIHIALIRTKVMFELQKRGFDELGKHFNNKDRKNYKAACEFNLEGMTDDLKNPLSLEMTPPVATKTKKESKAKNPNHGKVGMLIYSTLLANNTAKLTDQAIADLVNNTLNDGKTKTASHISIYRSYLNSIRQEVPEAIRNIINKTDGSFPVSKWNDKGEKQGKGRTKKEAEVVTVATPADETPADTETPINTEVNTLVETEVNDQANAEDMEQMSAE